MNQATLDSSPDLPVVTPGAEALLGHDAGPDVKALRAVPEELQLLPSLHLLAVLRQDEEGVGCHRVQGHVLCGDRKPRLSINQGW